MPLSLPNRHSLHIQSPSSLAGRSGSLSPRIKPSKHSPSSPFLLGQKSPRPSPTLSPALSPVKLSVRIESPPLVLYGPAKDSTGTLLSGLFCLDVVQPDPYPMEKVHLSIVQTITYFKTLHANPTPPANHSSRSHQASHATAFSYVNTTCHDCRIRKTELARWDVLNQPASLPHQVHAYPFSHLIPGSVPASCTSALFAVEYNLVAVAVPQDKSLKPFELVKPLLVSRSVIRGPDRNSIRVFPPTELTSNAVLPSVTYPNSSFLLELSLEGVTHMKDSKPSFWRMRKVNWRIDETTKMKAHFCSAHPPPPPPVNPDPPVVKLIADPTPDVTPSITPNPTRPSSPHRFNNNDQVQGDAHQAGEGISSSSEYSNIHDNGEGTSASASQPSPSYTPSDPSSTSSLTNDPSDSNASVPLARVPTTQDVPENEKHLIIDDTRTVGAGEIKSGWKSDFTGKGKVELQTEISTHALSKVVCNLSDPTYGLSISHVLVVELVVAEESTLSRSSRQTIPTGAARVLRMQFNLIVTERSGLGIAWDDEVPPTYADVPLSPPDYDNVAQLPKLEDVFDHQPYDGINSRLALI